MKEMGKSGQDGHRPGGRAWLLEISPPVPCRGGGPPLMSQPPLPGDGSATATCPVVVDAWAPLPWAVSVTALDAGVTKDRRQDVWGTCILDTWHYTLGKKINPIEM